MWNSLCQIGADLNLLVGPARCAISSVTFGVLYCVTTVSSWVGWVHGTENRLPLLISLETTLSPLSCSTFPSYFAESYLPSSTNMYILLLHYPWLKDTGINIAFASLTMVAFIMSWPPQHFTLFPIMASWLPSVGIYLSLCVGSY